MNKVKKFVTCDGWYACEHHRINFIVVSNCAATHVAYMLSIDPTAYHSEMSAIYPITPSSPMA